MSLFFFCCGVLHCVNVPHFPYPFFSQGTFRLFPGSGYGKHAAMYIVEHMSLNTIEHPLIIYPKLVLQGLE